MTTVNIHRLGVPELLQLAFGTSSEGVYNAESYLNEVPEGQKHTRKLALFGSIISEEHFATKQELRALAQQRLELAA